VSTDNVIALSSAIIALSALMLSIWQAYKIQEHNKLSLQPLLIFNYHSESKIMLHLTNCGLGPAIIKLLLVRKHNETDWLEVNEVFWYSYLKEYTGKIKAKFFYLSGLGVLQVNEEKELIFIQTNEPDDSLIDNIDKKIDDLQFKVIFETAYGQKQEVTSSCCRRH
jgi:hypothetical protein